MHYMRVSSEGGGAWERDIMGIAGPGLTLPFILAQGHLHLDKPGGQALISVVTSVQGQDSDTLYHKGTSPLYKA